MAETRHDDNCWWWDQRICTCGFAHQHTDHPDFHESNARVEALRDLEAALPRDALGRPVTPGATRFFYNKPGGVVHIDVVRMPDCSRSFVNRAEALEHGPGL